MHKMDELIHEIQDHTDDHNISKNSDQIKLFRNTDSEIRLPPNQ